MIQGGVMVICVENVFLHKQMYVIGKKDKVMDK